MFYLKDLLLWGLVSVHVIGAAFLFRRLLPGESRWLAFLFPELVFVLACNFVEHDVAVTGLRLLLPVTTVGAVAAIFWRGSPWRAMRAPTFIFLAAFTFTLGLRLLRPSIADAQDGLGDLHVMGAFLYGQTLPAEGVWMAPVKLESYYCIAHYGASVLTRLFGVEIGTGFNLSEALLSAYIYFIAGGIAWHLSRGRLWITILCVVLTASAATGSAGYVWLTIKGVLYPDNIITPHSLVDIDPPPDSFLVHDLAPIGAYGRHILIPPGYGGWMGYLHSTQTGQMLIGLTILALVEVLRRRRSNVPWLVLAAAPFLMLTCCTWGMPMVGFLIIAGTVAGWRLKVWPKNLPAVLALAAGLIVLFEPMLMYFLRSSYDIDVGWVTDCHTPLIEFGVQWWPIFLPGLFLACLWRRLHPVTRILLIMTPLAFAGVETFTAGLRIDTTEKCWGIIFAGGWLVFLPEILRQRAWACRVLALLLIVNSVLSFCFWTTFYYRVVNRDDIAHIDGLGPYRWDRRKARILDIVSRLPGQTILPGFLTWAPDESGLLPLFSHTRAFLSANAMSDWVYYPNALGEGDRRGFRVDDLYSGRLANPLIYLRQHNINAVVLYPDQKVAPNLAAQLKAQLSPYYTYEDANLRDEDQQRADVNPGDPAAGVFVYHPEVAKILGEPKGPPEK